jgi:hypothetical protein
MAKFSFPLGAIVAIIVLVWTLQTDLWSKLSDGAAFVLAIGLLVLFFSDVIYSKAEAKSNGKA